MTSSRRASLSPRERLAFALDLPTLDEARAAAMTVRESVGVLKVGLELFVAEGPRATDLGRELDCDVFLDLKLCDIPETVERSVACACALGVRYLTIHATGGPVMLERAARRAEAEATGLSLLAVTVLTSLGAEDLSALGIDTAPEDHVERLAKLAVACGVPGLVCSPLEVERLRHTLGTGPLLVTPGIRPAAAGDDQKRTATPERAIAAGADVLVVGRPIRDAPDPKAAARAILDAIAAAHA